MSYFQSIVLPSVGLPFKDSYNLTELCKIMGCNYSSIPTLQKRGLKIALNKRVYASELISFFEKEHIVKNWKK